MGSYKPYATDPQTGKLQYVADAPSPTRKPNLDKEMEHFKRNFSRLMGNKPHKAVTPKASGHANARGEALAYYNLYYYGHRIP